MCVWLCDVVCRFVRLIVLFAWLFGCLVVRLFGCVIGCVLVCVMSVHDWLYVLLVCLFAGVLRVYVFCCVRVIVLLDLLFRNGLTCLLVG